MFGKNTNVDNASQTIMFECFFIFSPKQKIFCLSGHNIREPIESEKASVKTKEYVWRQKKEYVGGAAC